LGSLFWQASHAVAKSAIARRRQKRL